MMKQLVLFISLLSIGTAKAGISEELYQSIVLTSDSLDTTLFESQSKYTFEFEGLDGTTNQMIYAIDGEQNTAELSNHSFQLWTTPGKHIFQFYYSENYYEMYSDSLLIQKRHHATYTIRMERSDVQIMVDKPVIYLYPQEETDVEVRLDIKGEPTFFYPKYEDSWKCKVAPSGEITIDENTYNYLFWESAQNRSFSRKELMSGYNVKGSEVVPFLEEKLSLAGFNSKEKADFITYWGPRLAVNDLNFVRFEFNEECNRYAELKIEPEPRHIFRLYISWMPIQAQLALTDQEIPSYSREGFTVLEWGGSEIKQKIQLP